MAAMKIDLSDLERIAQAAQAVDVEAFRGKVIASLSRGREGVHIPVRVPPEFDAHAEANGPPVTLALIARIRELEDAVRGCAIGGAIPSPHSTEGERRLIALLEKGAVIE